MLELNQPELYIRALKRSLRMRGYQPHQIYLFLLQYDRTRVVWNAYIEVSYITMNNLGFK